LISEPTNVMAGRRVGPRAAIGVMLLGLVVPWIAGIDALGWGHASHQTRWAEAIDRGVRAAADRAEGRRVIFVGGSACVFGIDARSLSERLGVPVINYGLHKGLGMDLIVARAMEAARPGDAVVFAPELSGFLGDRHGDAAMRADWMRLHPSDVRDWRAEFPGRIWFAGRERLRRARRDSEWAFASGVIASIARARGSVRAPGPTSPYQAEAVGPDGQIDFPRPGRARIVQDHSPPVDGKYDLERSRAAGGMRTVAQAARDRGFAFLVMPAARTVPEGATPEAIESWKRAEEAWLCAAETLGATRLLEPGETTLGPEFAYDTTNHLNDEGVAVMKDRIARAIAEWTGSGTSR